jgi:hypothetical protein
MGVLSIVMGRRVFAWLMGGICRTARLRDLLGSGIVFASSTRCGLHQVCKKGVACLLINGTILHFLVR